MLAKGFSWEPTSFPLSYNLLGNPLEKGAEVSGHIEEGSSQNSTHSLITTEEVGAGSGWGDRVWPPLLLSGGGKGPGSS